MKDTRECSHLSPPSSSLCLLSEWAHMDVSHSDRCLRRTRTISIPAVTITLAQTIADGLGHSQHRHLSTVSLYILVKRGGRARCPRQVCTARWRDLKQRPCTITIKRYREANGDQKFKKINQQEM